MDGIGDQFQQETKYQADRMPQRRLRWEDQPALYKTYPQAPRTKLPEFVPHRPMPLDQVLRERKSVREFSDRRITLGQLAYLLWGSTGLGRQEGGYAFRTAPSAGALYPIETYLALHTVKDAEAGLYHYNIQDHCLEQLKVGDFRVSVAQAALGQRMCADAAAVFIWAAVFDRSKWKYGQRAYRYIYLDAGHIAENLALAATSLKLGSCEIGALFDDQANTLIDIDGEQESTICMAAVGVPLRAF